MSARPVRDSNPSRLRDKQVATPAASQGGKECPAGVAPACPTRQVGASAARPRTRSARAEGVEPSGACFGGRLLSQEHTLDGQRKGQDSNLQGLSPRPLSTRVPSCLVAGPSVS